MSERARWCSFEAERNEKNPTWAQQQLKKKHVEERRNGRTRSITVVDVKIDTPTTVREMRAAARRDDKLKR